MNPNDNIYRQELMDIYKNPVHKGALSDPSATSHKNNPMCGHEMDLYLKIEDGVIKDASYTESACVVSVIASEILLEKVIGKKVEAINKMTKDEFLTDLGLNLSTSRVKCAMLVFEAVKEALEKYAGK